MCVCEEEQQAKWSGKGLAEGAPIDTADEGVHCVVKTPPESLGPAPTAFSVKVIHLLSIREGPQPSKNRRIHTDIHKGKSVCATRRQQSS